MFHVLQIQLNLYDSASSSTAGLIPCSDPMCTSSFQTSSTECSPQSNQCSYTFQYGDGSGTTGYYVSDALYFDVILGQSYIANSSAFIVFGWACFNLHWDDVWIKMWNGNQPLMKIGHKCERGKKIVTIYEDCFIFLNK